MKRAILFLAVFLMTLHFFGQRAPGKVRKALQLKYPAAHDVEWEYAGEQIREWTARFHVQQDSIVATYDHRGNWLLSLTFIPVGDLPETVVNAIRDEYQGADIILATIYEEPGFEGYGVAFHYKKDRWGVQVSPEGKIIRRRLTSEGFDF